MNLILLYCCNVIILFSPKRYLLSELIDWFHLVMRKNKEFWTYYRYDMRYDPLFIWKTKIMELISPNIPLAGLHMERLELECVTDTVLPNVPTLEDLGIQLTTVEEQVPWELRPYRAANYYDADLNEFETPGPPKDLSAKEELKLGIIA